MRPISSISHTLSEVEKFLGIDDSQSGVTLTGIAPDSRSVIDGDLFIAIAGMTLHSAHGSDFAAQAVAQGARAILTDGKKAMGPSPVPVIQRSEISPLVGDLASWFYGHPSRKMTTVGITGTNGKTTTASLLHQLWTLADREAGLIGTLGIEIGAEHFPATHTTPEAVTLQGALAAMAERHVTHAVMEVSSHALSQQRTAGTRFALVGFTNLTQDHLDFHGDMKSYFAAKAKLFTLEYADQGFINIDNQFGEQLVQLSAIPVTTLSRNARSAQWHYVRADSTSSGYEISIRGTGGILIEGFLPLLGDYNLDNALMAIAMAVESGVDPLLISSRLTELRPVPGRLERISVGQNFSAVVDFAHTPDSVERALATLRTSTTGKLIGILGCGGDRDKSKRSIMGKALAEGCDIAIFTSDNPRSEDAAEILKDMTAGLSLNERAFIEIDRRKAIERAVELAAQGDCIALLGKGHESGQEIKGVKIPFDDRIELARAIGGER